MQFLESWVEISKNFQIDKRVIFWTNFSSHCKLLKSITFRDFKNLDTNLLRVLYDLLRFYPDQLDDIMDMVTGLQITNPNFVENAKAESVKWKLEKSLRRVFHFHFEIIKYCITATDSEMIELGKQIGEKFIAHKLNNFIYKTK